MNQDRSDQIRSINIPILNYGQPILINELKTYLIVTRSKSKAEKHIYKSKVKFDAESKDFGVLPELYASEYHYVRLVNLKDCLSALVYGGYPYDSSVDVHQFDERRGCWSMMYNVGPITGDVLNWRKMNTGMQTVNGAPVLSESLLSCFKYGGEIVFSASGCISGCYRCYNHKTNKVTDLQNEKVAFLLN